MVPVQEAFNVTLPPVPIGSAAGTAAAVAAAAAKAAQSNLVVITGMKDEVLVSPSVCVCARVSVRVCVCASVCVFVCVHLQ